MKSSSLIFKLTWFLDHVFTRTIASKLFFPLYILQKSMLKNRLEKLSHGQGKDIAIEIDLSVDEFKRKYLATNTPVILKGGASSWPAVGKWDLDFFSENYGDETQPVIASSGEEILKHKRDGTKVDYVTMKEVAKNREELYGNFSPLVHKYKELRDELKLDWIHSLQNTISTLMMYQLFIGGKGRKTDLHSEISSNLFVMISGKKKWALCSPENNELLDVAVSREPCFHSPVNFIEKNIDTCDKYSKIDYYEFTLEEGDVLFIPPYFWHQVVNETDSVGLAIKWHNFGAYMSSSITQSILTSLSVNPPLWKLVGQGKYMNLFTDGRK